MCFLLVVSTVFETDNRSVYHELLYFINIIILKKIAFFALSRHVLHIIELSCLIKSVIRFEQDGNELNNITDKCYKILNLLYAPESQFLAYIIILHFQSFSVLHTLCIQNTWLAISRRTGVTSFSSLGTLLFLISFSN